MAERKLGSSVHWQRTLKQNKKKDVKQTRVKECLDVK